MIVVCQCSSPETPDFFGLLGLGETLRFSKKVSVVNKQHIEINTLSSLVVSETLDTASAFCSFVSPSASSDAFLGGAFFPFFQSSFRLACCGGAALVPLGMAKNFPASCQKPWTAGMFFEYLMFADGP